VFEQKESTHLNYTPIVSQYDILLTVGVIIMPKGVARKTDADEFDS